MVTKSSSHRPGLTPTGYRVLLIDDNGQLVEALEDGLRLMGHKVKSSKRGTDALRLIELLDPQVIITDLILPDFDVLNAIDEMRKAQPSAQIIAISGNRHLLALAVQRGVGHVLVKPFDLIRLDKLIRAVAR